MSIQSMLQEIAEREHVEHAPLYWVEDRPRCSRCHDNPVSLPGDVCEFCQKEIAQGYEILTMTGRRSNGFQADAGKLYHAVEIGNFAAMCGAKHGRRSDWSMYHGDTVTCPRCLKKLAVRS